MTAVVPVPEPSVGFLVGMIVRKRSLEFRSLIAPHGITVRQYSVLARLWEEDGLAVCEIARRLYCDVSSLSRTLARMEEQGVIRREIDAQNRRALRVHLTERGAGLYDVLKPAVKAAEARSLAGLSEGQVRALKRSLTTILDNLADHR